MCIRFLDGGPGAADRITVEVALPATELRKVWEVLLTEGLGVREAEMVVAGRYLTLALTLHEADGAALEPTRRREIQSTLIGALAPVGRARRRARNRHDRAQAIPA
jgi:hypothetical protein